MTEIKNEIKILYRTENEKKAAQILKQQLEIRAKLPVHLTNNDNGDFIFKTDDFFDRDSYKIENGNSVIFTAKGIRGFIFAIGYFLRKTDYFENKIKIIESIDGFYSPDKKIRGHQLGYRTLSNTYEGWTYEQYEKYMTELMFFGSNTMEHTHNVNKKENYNRLMKYDLDDFLKKASEIADNIDMDVSVWYPNEETPLKQYLSDRENTVKNMSRIDAIFPPGGDPGCFGADEFVNRANEFGKILKKHHPDAQLWPSAQAPDIENWGNIFIAEMEKEPKYIDGIITGPNRAFDLDILRQKLPGKYPIRLYPDVSHNLRCEYPVHFNRDDWHYSFSSTLSRETINPRPAEYALLHKLTKPYIVGSVTYSEGVSDDVNKCIWGNLDFFPDINIRTTLTDYARLYMYEAKNKEKIADGILALEHNWEGNPVNNIGIEYTYKIFADELKKSPALINNWRFVSLLFRAECDLFIREKMLFEENLIEKAKHLIITNEIKKAEKILKTKFNNKITDLRNNISVHGELLNKLIGLQLDVERFCSNGWERGSTLMTIDNPVTDRLYYLDRINYAKSLKEKERNNFFKGLINRNKVESDEYYFSMALDGLEALGVRQTPDFYMDFQGDAPNDNNGSMPMSMTKVFDHYTFDLKTGGLTGDCDYKLILNLKPRYKDCVEHFIIRINEFELYNGKQYGGTINSEWDKKYSCNGFETHEYLIPKEYIHNGCIELAIREEKVGVMISEVRILKTKE